MIDFRDLSKASVNYAFEDHLGLWKVELVKKTLLVPEGGPFRELISHRMTKCHD